MPFFIFFFLTYSLKHERLIPFFFQDLPGGGIKDDTSVEVEDFSQDLTVKLNIFHKTFDEEEVQCT